MSTLTVSPPSRPAVRPATVARRVPRQADRAPSRSERSERTARLLRRAARTTDVDERKMLLDEVVVLNMGVAGSVAARYRRRGIPDDDLQQVAYLALVKAVRGFDPSAGHDFLAYAVPTISGEVKRHFRDHGWTIRPPRRIQELQGRISAAESELTVTLGRSPRPSEIAAHLQASIEDVTEALANDGCFTPTSLDTPVGQDGSAGLGDLLGDHDRAQDAAEARVVLGPLVRDLCERDRRILMLRFFRGWTQQEIAQDIGVTQMQVSRLLARILSDLRVAIGDETAREEHTA